MIQSSAVSSPISFPVLLCIFLSVLLGESLPVTNETSTGLDYGGLSVTNTQDCSITGGGVVRFTWGNGIGTGEWTKQTFKTFIDATGASVGTQRKEYALKITDAVPEGLFGYDSEKGQAAGSEFFLEQADNLPAGKVLIYRDVKETVDCISTKYLYRFRYRPIVVGAKIEIFDDAELTTSIAHGDFTKELSGTINALGEGQTGLEVVRS